jgi:protein SCO1
MKTLPGLFSPVMLRIAFFAILCIVVFLWGYHRVRINAVTAKPSYIFLAEDSTAYSFPRDAAGKIVVVGFIYTHCSGVCGMISNTMAQARRGLDATIQANEVQFLSITFDPDRDTPSVLRTYAEAYTKQTPFQTVPWKFLSASTLTTDSVMKQFSITARKTFTTVDSLNAPHYFLDHTDRILLLNADGTVWKEYEGSEVAAETLVNEVVHLYRERSSQERTKK